MIFGIMGAMPDEVDQLCAKLENVTVEPYGGVDYHKGTLAGWMMEPVILIPWILSSIHSNATFQNS